MFQTLDRYLIREMLFPFCLSLVVLTFILLMPPIMEVAESLITKGVDWSTILIILFTLVPQGLGVTIPMAFLIGVLICFGRLSGDRETVALQACGVSIFRMLKPVAFLAILCAAATCYTLVVVLPKANQTFREITYQTIANRAQDELRAQIFYEEFPNIVLYVKEVSQDGGWSEVFLADTHIGDKPDIYVAKSGRILFDQDKRLVDIVLENGVGHKVDPWEPEKYEVRRFEETRIALDPDSVFPRGGPQRGYPELTLSELGAEVERLRELGESPHRPIIEIHRKFSIPVACLVFGLIGLALGVTSRKDGKLSSFVLGIAVIFAYYVIMYTAESMTKGSLLPPSLAMWLPNLILGVSGVFLLLWRARSAERRLIIPLPFSVRSSDDTQVISGSTDSKAKKARLRFQAAQVWRRPFNILDWYVVKLYGKIVCLAFLSLIGIFYISTVIDLSDKVFKGETDGSTLLEYLWFATPQFIYYVIPISALVATLVTIGLFTKTSELTVMKACGISLYRVATPLLLIGALWSALLFTLEDTTLAYANRRADEIRHVMRGGTPRTFDMINRKWIVGKSGSIYHYVYLDPGNDEINGLTLYEFNNWKISKRTFIAKAVFNSFWTTEDVWVRTFGNKLSPQTFNRSRTGKLLTLESPDYFKTERPDAERMNYRELSAYIATLKASGFDVVQLAVSLHRKLSFPPITIIMTLIALPFAVTTGRRGALYGIGIGIAVALSYWMIISVFAAIGSAGLITPILSAWAPNILFGATAVCLLLTVRT